MALEVFDTLKLARRLEAAGMPPSQATGFAEALSEIMTSELATTADLSEVRSWAAAEFAKLRTEIALAKNETIRWMVGLFLAQAAVVIGTLLRLVG